jgi:hypothetical protein
MRTMQRASLFCASAVLLFATVSPAAAAPSRASMNHLTIAITTTGGTVWGKVTATYTSNHKTVHKTCAHQKCTYQVPHGVMVHFKQTPTNTTTWPFKDWLVKTSHTATKMGAAVNVKMQGNLTVTAVYVFK